VKVTLSLTHDCNMSCRYCYGGRKFKKDMSVATAQKIVDFAVDITPPEGRIEFSFFGGEPFLRFDLIKQITNYVRRQERRISNPISISITSNGTLLTQPILDFLKKEEGINLCISIDGPAYVHNMNRCYKGGQGSFDDVVKNLCLALEKLETLQVNAVYGPDTIDSLPDSVLFFAKLGVSAIHLNPNVCAVWNEDICSKLGKTYLQIANHYIQSYQYGKEIAINLIDSKIIVFLKGGYKVEDKCGMGETEWGFAPSGNIYPCERLIGEDNDSSLCLGNIHTGLDLIRRCSLLEQRGNHNEECKACSLQKYCMNWCGCTNYHMTGCTDLTSPMICESEKAAIQAARRVLSTLKNNDLFVDHFLEYLHRGRHY
jgi:uncharacterized protein